MNTRLHQLDYLRGLAAFGIMIYHYTYWIYDSMNVSSFLGKIGIYGVSIFYILSGLTLYHVYIDKLKSNKKDTLTFFQRRIFRIFPLFWLATIGAIIVSRSIPSLQTLTLNFSGLFAFFAWDSNIATGAWSIGNELVFYCFFPIIIYFLKKSSIYFYGIFTISILISFIFSFYLLKDESNMAFQWRNNVNPFNQIFLFCSGIFIGKIFKNKVLNFNLLVIIFLISLFVFTILPIDDETDLISGYKRYILTFSCFLICIFAYKSKIKFHAIINSFFSMLGEASYSLYLLHPLVFVAISLLGKTFNISNIYILLISVVTTIGFSFLVYQYYERYFIGLGRRKIL